MMTARLINQRFTFLQTLLTTVASMAEIETIYRTRIDYEQMGAYRHPFSDPVDKVERFAFRVCDRACVECNAFSGNIAYSPHITLESPSLYLLEAAAGKIERYIRRFSRQLTLIE